MSRSAMHDAIARIDALIAKVHADCLEEGRVTAYADHHLGCTLHPSHGGDCVINRPSKPRYFISR
jgi:hypothetical protein